MRAGIGRQNIIILWGFTVSFLGIHKWEPDLHIGFSPALYSICSALHTLYCMYNRLSRICSSRSWHTKSNIGGHGGKVYWKVSILDPKYADTMHQIFHAKKPRCSLFGSRHNAHIYVCCRVRNEDHSGCGSSVCWSISAHIGYTFS
jgi:hypothetical protein